MDTEELLRKSEALVSQLEERCEQLKASRERLWKELGAKEQQEQTRNLMLREELIEAEKRADALSRQLSACQKERDELATKVSEITEERDMLNRQVHKDEKLSKIFGAH